MAKPSLLRTEMIITRANSQTAMDKTMTRWQNTYQRSFVTCWRRRTVDELQIKADFWASLHWALGFPCYPDLWPWPLHPPPKPACLLTWPSCVWPISTLEEIPTHSHLWRVKALLRERDREGERYEWERRRGRKRSTESKCHDSCINTGMPLRSGTGTVVSNSRGEQHEHAADDLVKGRTRSKTKACVLLFLWSCRIRKIKQNNNNAVKLQYNNNTTNKVQYWEHSSLHNSNLGWIVVKSQFTGTMMKIKGQQEVIKVINRTFIEQYRLKLFLRFQW